MSQDNLSGAETVPNNIIDGEDVDIKIDDYEICEKIIDGWRIRISKKDCTSSLDCEDVDFSTSVIWTSSSILDGNNNEVSYEGKYIDFSTSMIWLSSSILDNNDTEVSYEDSNSVGDERSGKSLGRSSTLISLISSNIGYNLAGISTGDVTSFFVTMSSFCLVSLYSIENSPLLQIDKKVHPSNLEVSFWFCNASIPRV